MPCALVREAQPGSAHDRGEVALGILEVLVDYNEIELRRVAHLRLRRGESAPDGVFAVFAAPAEASLELPGRGRKDEHADCVGEEPSYLLCALPVDLEQDVAAARPNVGDLLLRGGVEIAVHFGALEELARLEHALEGRAIDEVVLSVVRFASARRPGGVRDGQHELAVVGEHRVHERGLLGARWCGDDEEEPVHSEQAKPAGVKEKYRRGLATLHAKRHLRTRRADRSSPRFATTCATAYLRPASLESLHLLAQIACYFQYAILLRCRGRTSRHTRRLRRTPPSRHRSGSSFGPRPVRFAFRWAASRAGPPLRSESG